MKKMILAAFAAVALFSVTNVKAMTENELKAKLTKEYVIDGEKIKMSASNVAELDRYLKEYEISSEDADYISKKFDEALKIAQDGKAKSFTELTKEEKQKMIAIVSDISSKTSVKATLTEGGKLTIFEENGSTPFTVITDKDSGIQNTDSNNAILAIAGIVSVLGVAVVVKKVAKANA